MRNTNPNSAIHFSYMMPASRVLVTSFSAPNSQLVRGGPESGLSSVQSGRERIYLYPVYAIPSEGNMYHGDTTCKKSILVLVVLGQVEEWTVVPVATCDLCGLPNRASAGVPVGML